MIIELLSCFLLAMVISFLGSVQLGPVNLRVIQTAYNHNMGAAMVVAAGGILPEIIYSTIAIWCSWFLMANPILLGFMQLIAVAFFLISGIFMLFKSTGKMSIQTVRGQNLFASGFIAGMLNPMLYAFWLMIINLLLAENVIVLDTATHKIAFVMGTAAGAFLLLGCFAWLTQRNRKLLEQTLMGKMNTLVGAIFIILAVIQFIKWLP